jgi:hypothetical protein
MKRVVGTIGLYLEVMGVVLLTCLSYTVAILPLLKPSGRVKFQHDCKTLSLLRWKSEAARRSL